MSMNTVIRIQNQFRLLHFISGARLTLTGPALAARRTSTIRVIGPDRFGSRVVLDDETQAYELEPERVDAFDGTKERTLVHELSVENSHAVLGSQYELRECAAQRRPRLAAEPEFEGFAHADLPGAGSAHEFVVRR